MFAIELNQGSSVSYLYILQSERVWELFLNLRLSNELITCICVIS